VASQGARNVLHCQFSPHQDIDGDHRVSDDTTDWRNLREFKGIDLTRSFLLSWEVARSTLRLDVDLYILPDHPHYEKPRPSEKACFLAGHIDFPDCTQVVGDAAVSDGSSSESIADSTLHLGGGKISAMTRTGEGEYVICGDFGQVAIHGDRPMVRLKDRTV
jgi:hypothetical protein